MLPVAFSSCGSECFNCLWASFKPEAILEMALFACLSSSSRVCAWFGTRKFLIGVPAGCVALRTALTWSTFSTLSVMASIFSKYLRESFFHHFSSRSWPASIRQVQNDPQSGYNLLPNHTYRSFWQLNYKKVFHCKWWLPERWTPRQWRVRWKGAPMQSHPFFPHAALTVADIFIHRPEQFCAKNEHQNRDNRHQA